MVSRGAGSVTHWPSLWMAGLRGAEGGGGRLPRASTGTWMGMAHHRGSRAVVRSRGLHGEAQGAWQRQAGVTSGQGPGHLVGTGQERPESWARGHREGQDVGSKRSGVLARPVAGSATAPRQASA